MVVHDDHDESIQGASRRDIGAVSNAVPSAKPTYAIATATATNTTHVTPSRSAAEPLPSGSPSVVKSKVLAYAASAKEPTSNPREPPTTTAYSARKVPSAFGRASTPPPLPMPVPVPENLDVHDLNQVLQSLDRNMEMEIMMIRAKYERKRVPIVEAIHTRKGSKSSNQ